MRETLKGMARTRDEILESRRRLRTEYGELFDSLAALLYRHDPIGINFQDNTDEYELEAETIVPRLHSCRSADDVLQVVHGEFVRWFDAATLVRQSITRKSRQRFGNFGTSILLRDLVLNDALTGERSGWRGWKLCLDLVEDFLGHSDRVRDCCFDRRAGRPLGPTQSARSIV
jgi:hypothetical protein